VRGARSVAHSPAAVLAAFALYGVGGLIGFPISALVVVTGMVFGPLWGVLYAFAGAMLHAAATYGLGRYLGRHTVRRLAGFRLNRITRRLARRGVVAVAAIRLLPIASYARISLVAGASHVRFGEFMTGTGIGVALWIVLTIAFVDRLGAALNHPDPVNFVSLAVVAVTMFVAMLFVRRRFGDPGSRAED
jgi:uncharacterized membrane protein YdjX (TVP38/TMEM64 family)